MTRLPGSVEEIRYGPRRDGRHYRHQFRPGVRHLELDPGRHQISLPHGGVLLYAPRRRITADDRERGFWRFQRREENMARRKKNQWMWWALGGLAVWMFMSKSHAAAVVTADTSGSVVPADVMANSPVLPIF